MLEVDEDYETGHTRDGVKLILEEENGSLNITYADLGIEDTYHLVILLVDRLSMMVGQEYNQVLEDLKEIEGED